MKSYRLAVVGATGAVGQEILRTLERRQFPVTSLKVLASSRSVGRAVEFSGQSLVIEELNEAAFAGVDYALFSAGATRSREFAAACQSAGAVMIDNSSAFRMRSDVPLVVPEINAGDLANMPASSPCRIVPRSSWVWRSGLCTRRPASRASSYRLTKARAARARRRWRNWSGRCGPLLPVSRWSAAFFPHQIAFNVFSHNTAIAENGYNEEENKMVEETRKIFHEPELPIVATCVRVPVLRAHSESIVIETKQPLSPEEARAILAKAPGVKLVDDAENNHFPMPIEATGQHDVLVGRIRRDLSHPRGLALFVAGDQLLKGAAWNAVQILESLVGR